LSEGVSDKVEDFVVVPLEGHFKVEAYELGEVAMRVAVLGAEHWTKITLVNQNKLLIVKRESKIKCMRTGADGEDPVKIGGNGHLLVELRALGEVGLALKVGHGEDVGAALGRSRDDLGRVDLDESLAGQQLPEESADAGFKSEDGLVGGGAQVQDAVVQTRVLVHADLQTLLQPHTTKINKQNKFNTMVGNKGKFCRGEREVSEQSGEDLT